ncbi:MAG: universal stress protein [Deltaproteobacteria bacterium]|nr:universal stress protein [Deltaproteobacteria bacterium]
MPKKILCATDGTEVSHKAEAFAAKIARLVGAELTFVHVSEVNPSELTPVATSWETIIPEEVAAREHNVLQHAEEVARLHGYSSGRYLTVRSRDVAKAVVALAEKEGFEHIVAGSNGREGIPRFLLGSVAAAIIQKAHCPVTVVR